MVIQGIFPVVLIAPEDIIQCEAIGTSWITIISYRLCIDSLSNATLR